MFLTASLANRFCALWSQTTRGGGARTTFCVVILSLPLSLSRTLKGHTNQNNTEKNLHVKPLEVWTAYMQKQGFFSNFNLNR
jgi:hypothetical protein